MEERNEKEGNKNELVSFEDDTRNERFQSSEILIEINNREEKEMLGYEFSLRGELKVEDRSCFSFTLLSTCTSIEMIVILPA